MYVIERVSQICVVPCACHFLCPRWRKPILLSSQKRVSSSLILSLGDIFVTSALDTSWPNIRASLDCKNYLSIQVEGISLINLFVCFLGRVVFCSQVINIETVKAASHIECWVWDAGIINDNKCGCWHDKPMTPLFIINLRHGSNVCLSPIRGLGSKQKPIRSHQVGIITPSVEGAHLNLHFYDQ